MRILLPALFSAIVCHACAQHDEVTLRYNYAFIEDSNALAPLQGAYRVEYLARGQWWSYMDPRTPVDYPGLAKTLKPLIKVGGAPVMLVELEMDYGHTDLKLRVVRGEDTMIVDIHLRTFVGPEERMRARPCPPVLLPFRSGWFDEGELLKEPNTITNTERFDALWKSQHVEVLALFDTARYEFTLETDGLRMGPLGIQIMRDLNYARHLVHFPASGPGTRFELYRQDSLGVASTTMALRVEMPADGETGQWVDVTDLLYGKYSTYLRWGQNESLFYLTFGW